MCGLAKRGKKVSGVLWDVQFTTKGIEIAMQAN